MYKPWSSPCILLVYAGFVLLAFFGLMNLFFYLPKKKKMQPMVAKSSVEAECEATTLGIYELIWMKNLSREFQIKVKGPLKLYCDNKVALTIPHNIV